LAFIYRITGTSPIEHQSRRPSCSWRLNDPATNAFIAIDAFPASLR